MLYFVTGVNTLVSFCLYRRGFDISLVCAFYALKTVGRENRKQRDADKRGSQEHGRGWVLFCSLLKLFVCACVCWVFFRSISSIEVRVGIVNLVVCHFLGVSLYSVRLQVLEQSVGLLIDTTKHAFTKRSQCA